MESLTENEIKLFKNEFEKELVRLHESHDSPHSHWSRVIMPRQKIDQIIHHLKGIAQLPPSKMKSWIESRKFKVFNKPSLGLADVLMEPTKEKVVALGQTTGESILPRYLRVVPREEIFDTLLKIHLKHNHSTLRETAHLVRSVISNIPRYLVHKFILLCPVCSNNGATSNSAGLPYTPSRRCMIKARRRRKLMDQFQVDVLDLKDNPDGSYHYILHCMDHITGFHWLFPLAAIDPAEVAQNLVWGIFSLFGFPSELVSDYGKDFASAVIQEVTRLWPDELLIKNYLEGSSYKGDVSPRNTRNVTRFIEHMAGQKAALGDSRLKWSEWLPEIQFLLNSTILDVRTGKTPYEKVFRMHPITPPPKTKLGPAPGEVPSKKSMPKRRRHHLKYTPEFLTEDVVDQAKVLNVDGRVPDAAVHALVATPTHEVVVSGPNDVHFVDGSGHHHGTALVEETVEGMVTLGVAQEVVSTSHDAVPSSSAMSLSTSGNVVVVDIAGVEHTVENTVITDGYVTTGVEEVIPSTEEHIVTQFVQGGDAYNFGAGEAAAYSILPAEHAGPGGVDAPYQVMADDPSAAMSFVPSTHTATAYVDNDDGEETTYIDETSAAERCVTLSADGRQLEVAQIRPAPLPVKIGSSANKSYRIEPFSRTVEYVQDGRARDPNVLSTSSVDPSYTSLSASDASLGESVSGMPEFRYPPTSSFEVTPSSGEPLSPSTTPLIQTKDIHTFTSAQITSPTRNKRVIHLSTHNNKRKVGALSPTKNVFKTFEVTSFGPGSSPAPSTSASLDSSSEQHHTLLFSSSGVPTLKMPSKPPTGAVRSRIISKGSLTKSSPLSSGRVLSKSTNPQMTKGVPGSKAVPATKAPKLKGPSDPKEMTATPQVLPVSKGTTESRSSSVSRTPSKSKSFTGFSSTKLDDVDPNAGLFNDEFESSDEGDFEGVLSGDESEEMYL